MGGEGRETGPFVVVGVGGEEFDRVVVGGGGKELRGRREVSKPS